MPDELNAYRGNRLETNREEESMPFDNTTEAIRKEEWARLFRRNNAAAERWAQGYGAIRHTLETQAEIFTLAETLAARSVKGDGVSFFDLLHGADRIASMAMWLVVHETYARNVYLDGRNSFPKISRLPPKDTRGRSEHGSCLRRVHGRHALTGTTRSWIMGQGHCVAAIDSVNLLLGNISAAHAGRYSVTDEGLTRLCSRLLFVQDRERRRQDSPLAAM